jgi:hypothetical protein
LRKPAVRFHLAGIFQLCLHRSFIGVRDLCQIRARTVVALALPGACDHSAHLLLIALSAIQAKRAVSSCWCFAAMCRSRSRISSISFSFSALRLWMTLAVLVFALRESYRDALA